jgi:hypothetical protein
LVTRLKHIAPIQCAVVLAVLYALFGIIGGIIFIPYMALISSTVGDRSGMGPFAGIGIFAVVLFPIFYGIGGFIGGLIMAFLYNLVARWTGGLEVTFEPAVTPM